MGTTLTYEQAKERYPYDGFGAALRQIYWKTMTPNEWDRAYSAHYYENKPWPDLTPEQIEQAKLEHADWCLAEHDFVLAREQSERSRFALIRRAGMNPDRKLSSDCADFYLLEWLDHTGRPGAKRMLAQHSKVMAQQFSAYLDLTLGGEARYGWDASRRWGVHIPSRIAEYVESTGSMDRHESWEAWLDYADTLTSAERTKTIASIRDMMFDDRWGGDGEENVTAGGHMWGLCARVLVDYRMGTLNDRIFVDRCFTLEHNNGCVLDKAWSVEHLGHVLNLQAVSRYDTLATFASRKVREMWKAYRHGQREDFDSGWLGVQEV